MNNNRSNRRRGRGSNRSQGNQSNRIDSRARGNAPQLLDKYKKLAHDASMNGDRVQAEYYLQFADHYFRVIADGKAQREDSRARREDDGSDSPGEDQHDRSPRRGRGRRDEHDNRDDSDDDRDDDDDDDDNDEDERSDGKYEPAENPFTRGNRSRTDARRPRGRRASVRERLPRVNGFSAGSYLPSERSSSSLSSSSSSSSRSSSLSSRLSCSSRRPRPLRGDRSCWSSPGESLPSSSRRARESSLCALPSAMTRK